MVRNTENGEFFQIQCVVFISKALVILFIIFFGTIYDLSFVLEIHTFLSKICVYLFLLNNFDDRSKDGYFARLKLGKATMNKYFYLFQVVFSKVMPTVTLQHLANVFKIFGPFEELSLEMKVGTEENTGHGMVSFLSPESAKLCVKQVISGLAFTYL